MLEFAIIYYSVALLNAFYFLIGKRNDIIAFLSCAFYILFVIGKRYDGSFIAWDLGNYQVSYGNMAEYQTAEIGYKYLCIFANAFKLKFETFYMILASSYLTAIFLFVKRIGGNLHLVVFAAMLYFVLVHFDQLRNQTAFALMLFIVFPLNSQLTQRQKILSIIGVFFSSIFHISFVLYTIPLVLSFVCRKKNAWFFFAVMIFLLIIVKATSSIGILDSVLQDFISSNDYTSQRYEKYTESNANLSFLAPLSIYLVLLCALLYWNKYVMKSGIIISKKRYVDCEMFVKFILFSSIFVLLTTVNSVMYRYVRDITFIMIMYLGINSTGKLSKLKDRFVIFSATTAVCIGWFVFDIFLKGYWLDYLSNFFTNEIFEL